MWGEGGEGGSRSVCPVKVFGHRVGIRIQGGKWINVLLNKRRIHD